MIAYFTNIPPESEYLFYRVKVKKDRPTGKIIREYVPLGDFKRAWGTACKKAGVKNFRFHDLRHQATVHLRRQGVPQEIIMRIAGWRTSEIYRRYSNIESQDIMETLKVFEKFDLVTPSHEDVFISSRDINKTFPRKKNQEEPIPV